MFYFTTLRVAAGARPSDGRDCTQTNDRERLQFGCSWGTTPTLYQGARTNEWRCSCPPSIGLVCTKYSTICNHDGKIVRKVNLGMWFRGTAGSLFLTRSVCPATHACPPCALHSFGLVKERHDNDLSSGAGSAPAHAHIALPIPRRTDPPVEKLGAAWEATTEASPRAPAQADPRCTSHR